MTAKYPDISNLTGENFRLYKVNMVLSQLDNENKHYEHVRKKYVRIRSVFHVVAISTGSLSAILTSAGIGTSLTGPGLVVGIPLSGVAALFGLVSAGCGVLTKRITKKISKHEKTIQLIQTKKNTIDCLVSKALNNNEIDEGEFKFIMGELQKYESLKQDIRSKKNETILKNDVVDIEKLRENVKKEILDKLTSQKN